LITKIDYVAPRLTPDTDDPVALNPQDAGPDDLAGVDIKQPSGFQCQLRWVACARSI
jgi:hypothetical protein